MHHLKNNTLFNGQFIKAKWDWKNKTGGRFYIIFAWRTILSFSRLRKTQKALQLPFFLFFTSVFGKTGDSCLYIFLLFFALGACDQYRTY